MGFGRPVRRSTLADAPAGPSPGACNEVRDWRIYAEFAQRLIAQARRLYVGESLLGDLDNTVYALDSTTIDLCLSLFPWAHFRSTKAAVKMHTLLDLRGNIPSFIHISDGKLHDVHALDLLVPEAGAIYVMDRGYVDFARLYGLHQAGALFVTRAKSNLMPIACIPPPLIARPVSSTAPADQVVLWDLRKCGEDPDLDCGIGLRADRHRAQAVEAGCVTLHIDAGVFGDSI
jgi:hypothetical protein